MPWPPKNDATGAFSDEDVCIVSKRDTCVMWAGTKVLYSGLTSGGQGSGYNFLSGEVDIGFPNASGWGEIRIPELNQLHKVFVFPHDPTIIGRAAYTNLNIALTTSGYPNGHGGCSGKIALIHYQHTCSGCELSGSLPTLFTSGSWTSGLIDIIAFGSEY